MNSFDFYSPTYFVFGRDRENDTGKYVAKFGGSRVLIVYGGQSGLLDRVKASVNAAGLYSIELGGVKSNPKSGFVYEGIELARREKIDFLVAIGGGSVIDTAKAIAMGVPYDGDFWDFFSGKTPHCPSALFSLSPRPEAKAPRTPSSPTKRLWTRPQPRPTASARSSPS